jgi:hypothetical protein
VARRTGGSRFPWMFPGRTEGTWGRRAGAGVSRPARPRPCRRPGGPLARPGRGLLGTEDPHGGVKGELVA